MADPVADFLAREQDMLAEIEGGAAPPAAPAEAPQLSPNSDHASEGFEIVNSSETAPADNIEDDFGAMAVGDPAPLAAPVVPALGQISGADSGVDLAGMDLGGGAAQPAAANHSSGPSPVMNGGSGSSGPSPIPAFPKIEAENIRKWREQQQRMLEQKDADEERKKEDWRAQAKRELEDWYQQKEAALQKTKENNKKMESEYAAQREREQGSEAAWEEIAKLCEAKPKAGVKDVTRMKSLLLVLKEHQNKATEA